MLLFMWPLLVWAALALTLAGFALWTATRRPKRPRLLSALSVAIVIVWLAPPLLYWLWDALR